MMRISINTPFRGATANIVMFLLIGITGNPYFYHSNWPAYLLLGLCTAIAVITRLKLHWKFFVVMLFFGVLQLFQFMHYNEMIFISYFGLLAKITIGYLLVLIIGERFTEVFTRQMAFLSIVSLFFYFIVVLDVLSFDLLSAIAEAVPNPFPTSSRYDTSPSLIVFTVHETLSSAGRNSGAFWEPGGFALFLNLALGLEWLRNGTLFTRRGLLFIFTILTTFSTGGLFALFFLLSAHFVLTKNVLFASGVLVVLIGFSWWSYNTFSFLGEKVEKNLVVEKNASRFGSAKTDLEDFSERFLIGWGRFDMARSKSTLLSEDDYHRNNGLTFLLSSYGLIGTLGYLWFLWTSLMGIVKRDAQNHWYGLVLFGLILIMSFSQSFFIRDFFFGILFLDTIVSNPREINYT